MVAWCQRNRSETGQPWEGRGGRRGRVEEGREEGRRGGEEGGEEGGEWGDGTGRKRKRGGG